MGPQTLPFPAQPAPHFQGFPAMGVPAAAAPAMMGNMMGQSVPLIGQNVGMMVGMGMPNGFSVTTQTAALGLPQNIGGPQGTMVGQVAPPQKYGMQQTQQTQWNLSQVGIFLFPSCRCVCVCVPVAKTKNPHH